MKVLALLTLLFITASVWAQKRDDVVDFPDVEAKFKGGPEGLQRYISSAIKYPKEAIDMDIMGKVYISFVVEVDGSISTVKIERGAHPTLDSEAYRVVKNMPNWTPGEFDDEKVATRCRLPIVFTLTSGRDARKQRKLERKMQKIK
jgi:TonB family protein